MVTIIKHYQLVLWNIIMVLCTVFKSRNLSFYMSLLLTTNLLFVIIIIYIMVINL